VDVDEDEDEDEDEGERDENGAGPAKPTKPKSKLKKLKKHTPRGELVKFDELDTFVEHDDEYDGFLGDVGNRKGDPEAANRVLIPDGPMDVETSDSDTEDDDHASDQIGNIPLHWYDDEDHVGYDLNGKKVLKSGVEKDRLDKFLSKMDDPDYGRTIIDPLTKREIRLTDEEVDMIKRIQGGNFPDANYDPYEDYVDFFTYDKMVMPLPGPTEPKNRFVPSKWEHKRVMKMVRAIRKGWLKPYEEEKKEIEFFDIWKDMEDPSDVRRRPAHIAPPKTVLPGHAESYNPPPEYIPTPEEEREWQEMDPEDRPQNFLPKRYTSLRLVPGYDKFVQERFGRCLDLYICPRAIKQRVRVDPESLIPKLPKLQDLMPYPTVESLCYVGHEDRVTTISPDPTGRWLVSGSEDCTLRFWEVSTGRCVKVLRTPSLVTSVSWCPNAAIALVAVTFGNTLWLVNPKLGSSRAWRGTDTLVKPQAAADEEAGGGAGAGKKSTCNWKQGAAGSEEYGMGIRFDMLHPKEIEQVTWHQSGKYFATVMGGHGVYFHNLMRQHSLSLMSKKQRDVQKVLFHPTKPCFIVATKVHVLVFNLKTQKVLKKLLPGTKWNSCVAIHPGGDNILLGSLDRRLCWFDLDLSTKPYKTLRYHKLALRAVAYHPTYPLFASAGDEGVTHVFHGQVYDDLMQNPLIVPVKMLKGHTVQKKSGLGVLDVCFHPRQPWLFSAGADKTIRLFTN